MNSQAAQHEQIRRHLGDVFGLEFSAEVVADLAQTAPAAFHLLAGRTCERIAGGRQVTDVYLRTLPEPLFDHLFVNALAFMRRGWTVDVDELQRSELYLLMTLLLREECGGDDGLPGNDDQVYAMAERFSRLVLLEEARRAGAFAWVNPYSLRARVDDVFPPRLPVVDRRTEH